MDPYSGRTFNANVAEFYGPRNADVTGLKAVMVAVDDPHLNALGVKSVITGSAGAVAKAVWHAIGIRIRRFRSASKTCYYRFLRTLGDPRQGDPLNCPHRKCSGGVDIVSRVSASKCWQNH